MFIILIIENEVLMPLLDYSISVDDNYPVKQFILESYAQEYLIAENHENAFICAVNRKIEEYFNISNYRKK